MCRRWTRKFSSCDQFRPANRLRRTLRSFVHMMSETTCGWIIVKNSNQASRNWLRIKSAPGMLLRITATYSTSQASTVCVVDARLSATGVLQILNSVTRPAPDFLSINAGQHQYHCSLVKHFIVHSPYHLVCGRGNRFVQYQGTSKFYFTAR